MRASDQLAASFAAVPLVGSDFFYTPLTLHPPSWIIWSLQAKNRLAAGDAMDLEAGRLG